MGDLHDADPAPVTESAMRAEPGWVQQTHAACSCLSIGDGLVLYVWPNTGGVVVTRDGTSIRLVESGCTLGRLRHLVAALTGEW